MHEVRQLEWCNELIAKQICPCSNELIAKQIFQVRSQEFLSKGKVSAN